MKALSVKQPWAELIARGEKTIEVHGKVTKHGGPPLIVSCKSPAVWKTGCTIAVVDLVGCRPTTKADADAAVCERRRGDQAWVLENPRRVEPPLPIKGQQGIYNVDLDLGRLGIR